MRVIAIDDHPLVLTALGQILGDLPAVQLVGCASTIIGLRDLLARHAADVLIADYSLPREDAADGLTLVKWIQRQYPHMKIVVFTMQDNAAIIRVIIENGVAAVVSKRDPLTHIAIALERVDGGLAYQSPTILTLLNESWHTVRGTALSDKELEVLRLFAAGMSMTEVAVKINRTVKTASAHKVSAMRKIGARNDSELYNALRELRFF
ncbi:hypothetical protein DDE05_12580 [Streptomyces cavourensis]|jgi:two-component system capsular synthesis response regulator RcsB|uniref:response regulator n=1 Tax=unclassified Achromobacter TaxID=2626865 RepID=UPI000E027304|nr:hypothetical protein DDE05_12580 [Streptomyces cavourensis]